eukprot:scaffold33969_cov47-Phaeocystis_antarctica.AAC.2
MKRSGTTTHRNKAVPRTLRYFKKVQLYFMQLWSYETTRPSRPMGRPVESANGPRQHECRRLPSHGCL